MNIVGRFLSNDDIVVGLDVSHKIRALEEASIALWSSRGQCRPTRCNARMNRRDVLILPM